jgi:hypothetical protein
MSPCRLIALVAPPRGYSRGSERLPHHLEHLAAEDFAFAGQPATLIVGQEDSPFAEFFFEDLVHGAEVFDDILVLAIDPTGQDDEQELPGLEDEVHGGPDAAAGQSLASVREDGPSMGRTGSWERSRKPRPRGQLQLG